MNFETHLESLSALGAEGMMKAETLSLSIRTVLSQMGVKHFAALTSSIHSKITRALTTFCEKEQFFGKDLATVFDQELLRSVYEERGPILRALGLGLKSPFDRAQLLDPSITSYCLYRIYKDRFNHGYFVVFADDQKVLEDQAWKFAEIAYQSIELMDRLLPKNDGAPRPLNDREIAVMKWTYEGHTAAEVAAIISTSARNVTYYINCCLAKLETKNKIQAAIKAKQMGLF